MFIWFIYYYYKILIFVAKIIFKTLLCNITNLHNFFCFISKFKFYENKFK